MSSGNFSCHNCGELSANDKMIEYVFEEFGITYCSQFCFGCSAGAVRMLQIFYDELEAEDWEKAKSKKAIDGYLEQAIEIDQN